VTPLPAAALAGLLAVAAAGVHAQAAPADARTRSLAATCTQCHGTDGKALPGETMVRLAGLPKEHIATQMRAFREGQRPATVMHQLAKGYTDAQIDALAAYFAAVK
jgi:sulfide dehydrogenase cytochrome subunit